MTTKWVLGGYTFEANPDKDTGWQAEVKVGKQHPPGSNTTVVQSGGKDYPIRKCSGIVWAKTLHDNLEGLKGTQVSHTDHFNDTKTVFVETIEWEQVIDIANPPYYVTWKYQMLLQRMS